MLCKMQTLKCVLCGEVKQTCHKEKSFSFSFLALSTRFGKIEKNEFCRGLHGSPKCPYRTRFENNWFRDFVPISAIGNKKKYGSGFTLPNLVITSERKTICTLWIVKVCLCFRCHSLPSSYVYWMIGLILLLALKYMHRQLSRCTIDDESEGPSAKEAAAKPSPSHVAYLH